MLLTDIFPETWKHGEHEKGWEETEDLGHMKGESECGKFLVREGELTEIVWQETEVEAVYDIDDTEGKSHFEYIPCKMRIDFPYQVDFPSDEIETEKQRDHTSENKGQKNENDAMCIREYREMSGIFEESIQGDKSQDLPDDESESGSPHHIVCLEHTITHRSQKIQE